MLHVHDRNHRGGREVLVVMDEAEVDGVAAGLLHVAGDGRGGRGEAAGSVRLGGSL